VLVLENPYHSFRHETHQTRQCFRRVVSTGKNQGQQAAKINASTDP
jgi:hypothetical protein